MARRIRRPRMRTPRRSGDWFVANHQTAFANVGADVQTDITLLSAFDEPVTCVRIVGSVFITPQADAIMHANWAVWNDLPGDSTLVPDSSPDVATERIMLYRCTSMQSSTVGRVNNVEQTSAVDIKVKRKMNPESRIILSIHSLTAYSYIVNLRAYVLLA